MEAVKFIKERNRMCDSYAEGCDSCPLYTEPCIRFRNENAERVVGVVEEWSVAHPLKTRQSAFLEQWPEAEIDDKGCLMLCPITVSAYYRNRHSDCATLKCSDCRREFWMQEVE